MKSNIVKMKGKRRQIYQVFEKDIPYACPKCKGIVELKVCCDREEGIFLGQGCFCKSYTRESRYYNCISEAQNAAGFDFNNPEHRKWNRIS